MLYVAAGTPATLTSLGVETPICEAVAAVLAGETTVDVAIDGLLSRPLKVERH